MRLTRLQTLRMWFLTNCEVLGLPIAATALVVIAAAIWWVAAPRGAATPAIGVIIGMSYSEGDESAGHPEANVRLRDRVALVSLPLGTACKVGDTIRLRRAPTRYGELVAAADNPC